MQRQSRRGFATARPSWRKTNAAFTPSRGWTALKGTTLLIGLVAGPGPAASAERPAAVYAYLADNTVVRTDEQFGIWRIRRIAPKAAVQGGAGHSLAFSADGRTLWALSVTGQRLVALAPTTLAIRKSVVFAPTEVPRALAVGRRTGRLYVAYTVERPVPKRRDQPKDARLRILDPAGTRKLADTLVRPAGRRSCGCTRSRSTRRSVGRTSATTAPTRADSTR